MPDEHFQWRHIENKPAEPVVFQARKTAEAYQLEPRSENPYRNEAELDRLLIRWCFAVMILLVLIGILVWQVFFT